MIAAYHLIFGAYGFWLPNDPRGSWSTFVGSWELYRYGGRATKTTETQSLAYREHDHAQRMAAKLRLKRPPILFSGVQARAIGRSFSNYCWRRGVSVFACAILPDHIHLVTGPLPMKPEHFVIQLKGAATRKLVEEKLHPFAHLCGRGGRPPKCFARGEWKVFLDPEDVPNAVCYVEENPEKEGLRRQHWNFVVPYS